MYLQKYVPGIYVDLCDKKFGRGEIWQLDMIF